MEEEEGKEEEEEWEEEEVEENENDEKKLPMDLDHDGWLKVVLLMVIMRSQCHGAFPST